MKKRIYDVLAIISLIIVGGVFLVRLYYSLLNLDFSKSIAYIMGYIGAEFFIGIVPLIYLFIWAFLKVKKK